MNINTIRLHFLHFIDFELRLTKMWFIDSMKDSSWVWHLTTPASSWTTTWTSCPCQATSRTWRRWQELLLLVIERRTWWLSRIVFRIHNQLALLSIRQGRRVVLLFSFKGSIRSINVWKSHMVNDIDELFASFCDYENYLIIL